VVSGLGLSPWSDYQHAKAKEDDSSAHTFHLQLLDQLVGGDASDLRFVIRINISWPPLSVIF
jgi:hypothetical protein